MKKVFLTILTLFILLLSSFLFVSAQHEGFEEKIYSEATIDDDFDGSSVLVVMDKNVGEINKVHKESFFGNFPKEYIKDLTELTVDIKEALIDVDNFRQILQIKLPEDSKENVLNVIRQLEKIEGIVYAGPSYAVYADATTPNDPSFVNQWGLHKINAPLAWDITQGSSIVKVGIIDTGIDPHPDLNANLVAGWNFVSNNNSTGDTNGHGTHVAGIVGAVGNNYTGISGVSWNVKLVPLKISGYDSEIIDAINYAKNNYIPILNLSWSGPGNNNALLTAINGYSGLFVCSAGNGDSNGIGYNIGTTKIYPASWSSPSNRIITVGATNSDDTRVSFSNFSSTSVDIFAPGGENVNVSGEYILSTYKSGQYVYLPGTSMAAPFVTGVAALLKAQAFALDARSIKKIIKRTVDTPPALNGLCVTNGRLNASVALNFTVQNWMPCQQAFESVRQICLNNDAPAQAAMCPGDCEQQAWSVCGGPWGPCIDWYYSCVSNCEQQAYSFCDDQYNQQILSCS